MVQRATNLNRETIEVHDGGMGEQHREVFEAASRNGKVRVYFDDLERRLVSLIEAAEVVLGCVAWLTSEPILIALARKKAVALVVQKEDFLRPDLGDSGNWRARLQGLYSGLRCELTRYDFDNVVGMLSTGGDCTLPPVRCAGIYSRDRAAAAPRMHHKFLIFADILRNQRPWGHDRVKPHTVWTGSYNLTRNATFSLENAVVLVDPEIVAAYYEEWGHIEALSEPLNWEEEWVSPEWRIGT
jgi:phosphatidylserine/phosphatidylglycerophosphate/cardiolipin synthase-like enzyme